MNNIEFKMLRKDKDCWIKIAPCSRASTPTSLHIILNKEEYGFDIYDRHGNEMHNVFLKGKNITPSFYIKSEQNCYRVDCKNNDIKTTQITEKHNIEEYLKNNCSYDSPQTTIWAVNIFYTKTPDKPPFDIL
ncbi:MAG: hypothetical protein QHH19_01720 [Candidatus Thermoplasmatota archaeon]|nr:hypothetical protein [Candidatus Thermoplasmatota archaeon]